MNARIFIVVLMWLLAALPTVAHEIRPAYFEIVEKSDGGIDVLWKQPLLNGFGLGIEPQLSAGWLKEKPAREFQNGAYHISQWRIAASHAALAQQQLVINGLDKTITDVLVRIHFANGVELTQLIKPEQPRWIIPAAEKTAPPVAQYITLGVEHIWTGIDHLLYVFGLILLVNRWSLLLKTITAFTLAHSITLAAAALNIVQVPSAPVEAVIALSIVYVAVELINSRRGNLGIAQRAPWLIAFAFGLLHGFGFAGALAETGLPKDNIPLALLLFNVGIEVGQLLFVALVLATLAVLQRQLPRMCDWILRGSPHVIGSFAACWLIERTLVAFRLIAH